VYINEAYHDALTGENEPIYRLLVSLSNWEPVGYTLASRKRPRLNI